LESFRSAPEQNTVNSVSFVGKFQEFSPQQRNKTQSILGVTLARIFAGRQDKMQSIGVTSVCKSLQQDKIPPIGVTFVGTLPKFSLG
jgi:hypothetical protein